MRRPKQVPDPYHGDPGPFTNRYGLESCEIGRLRRDIIDARIAHWRKTGESLPEERHEFKWYTETTIDGVTECWRCSKCYAVRGMITRARRAK